jgi:hypothetical protein
MKSWSFNTASCQVHFLSTSWNRAQCPYLMIKLGEAHKQSSPSRARQSASNKIKVGSRHPMGMSGDPPPWSVRHFSHFSSPTAKPRCHSLASCSQQRPSHFPVISHVQWRPSTQHVSPRCEMQRHTAQATSCQTGQANWHLIGLVEWHFSGEKSGERPGPGC